MLPDVVRLLVRHALLLSALIIGLTDLRSLTRFVYLVQVIVIINCGISLWETVDTRIVSDIAYTLNDNATAFNELRPAGLWSNPNQAAFAFLFALLLSYWSRGPIAWLGRTAAIVGLFLTASRSGVYLLLLSGALLLLFRFHTLHLTPGRMFVLTSSLALIICLGWAVSLISDFRSLDLADNWHLTRILDFSESDSGQATRIDIANMAAAYALGGPWYGYGIFTFQGANSSVISSALSIGVHNIYLAVFGEVGILGLASYLLVLAYSGVVRVITNNASKHDKFVLFLMWLVYFLIGLVWHNQLSSFSGVIYIGLLIYLPSVMSRESHHTTTIYPLNREAGNLNGT